MSNIELFTILVLLTTFVLVVLGSQVFRRGRVRLSFRRIAAYRAMPAAVSEAVESERPLHVSFGGSGLGLQTTVSTLAVTELLYYLAERNAVGNKPPIVSLSDPTTLGLVQGTLRRAYERQRNLEAYRSTAARWYPQGARSLAFGAGVASALAQEDASTSVIAGRFGPEMIFIGETAARYNQFLFAQSDQLDGQAVAWVISDTPLIGEELYVAGAYLPRKPTPLHVSQMLAMDVLRFLVIAAIVVIALLSSGLAFVRNVVANPLPFLLIGLVVVVVAALAGTLFYRARARRGPRPAAARDANRDDRLDSGS